MAWKCVHPFTCYPGDVETKYLPGDDIPEAVAKECNLAAKPEIAVQGEKPKK